MTETVATTPADAAPQATTGIAENEKKLATIVYALQAIGCFTFITALIGVIMNHVKSGDLQDPVVKSHFSWQMRTFWWSFFWGVLAIIGATVTFGIGGFLFIPLFIWYIYRVVKGWLRLNDGKTV